MKRGLAILIILIVLAYISGLFYYLYKSNGPSFSPFGNCGCSYELGDSFSDGYVTSIKKDTCSATNICSKGYCIIEYGSEKLTSTVSCK